MIILPSKFHVRKNQKPSWIEKNNKAGLPSNKLFNFLITLLSVKFKARIS